MAKESEERKKVKEKLIKKNDKLPFSLSLYVKVSRMVQDLNRLARANRLVEPEDVLYSDSFAIRFNFKLMIRGW